MSMSMREYETVFVLNPAVDDAQVDAEVERIREFLTGKNGQVTEIQKWGRRKLAYEVGKSKEGIYTLIRFHSDSSVPAELDRRYRLNENMLRFLTVVYEKPPVEIPRPEGAAPRGERDEESEDEDER
jgi:small subunit ribosomal protein S6